MTLNGVMVVILRYSIEFGNFGVNQLMCKTQVTGSLWEDAGDFRVGW